MRTAVRKIATRSMQRAARTFAQVKAFGPTARARRVLEHQLLARLHRTIRAPREDAPDLERRVAEAADAWALTRRQRDVLALVVRGLATATIADALGIGTRAVELHVTALLDRAGVDGRAALVAAVLGR